MNDETQKQIEISEKELSYLFSDIMTTDQKLKALEDAHFQAWNPGYGDAMANKLMGRQEDDQTRLWEKNCKNKYIIDELLGLLKETEE